MPHISLPEGLPGITSGFAFRPETAEPMRELAEMLLRGPNTLTSGEREMIAAFVSSRNDCHFCQASHRAAAAHHLDGNYALVDAVKRDYQSGSDLGQAESAAGDRRQRPEGRQAGHRRGCRARASEGATDTEIHDTVLIAAAFCMFNRYVDGLATLTPDRRLRPNGRAHGTRGICPARGASRRWRVPRPHAWRDCDFEDTAMPHINLPPDLPGIRGPMAFRPETAKPLNELVDVLLRGPHTLTPGERELIATFVSSENDCRYCQTIHGAVAAHHLDGDETLVVNVKTDFEHAAVSEKLKALLVIAGKTARAASTSPRPTSLAPAIMAPRTSRFTIRCSSPRCSACATATSTGWRPGRPTIPPSTVNAPRSSRRTATRRPRSRRPPRPPPRQPDADRHIGELKT